MRVHVEFALVSEMLEILHKAKEILIWHGQEIEAKGEARCF